jgi:hypothetical protein
MTPIPPRRISSLATLAAVLAGWLACPPSAPAQRPLRRELAEVAKVVRKHLRDRGEEVALGPFTCAAEAKANYGPGIVQMLAEELKKVGLRIDLQVREARFVLQGAYRVITDTSTRDRQLAIKLEVKLRERGGKGIELDVDRAVVVEQTVAAMLGLTVALQPGGSAAERAKELTVAFRQEKKPLVEGGRIAAGPDGRYGVELLVKRGGRYEPVKPRLEDNEAYAGVARDEVYALRLYNDTEHEAAATVTIDGIDLFAFCDVKPASLILAPKSNALLRGWPITLEKTNEFLVTAYPESAAFRLESLAPVGVINVAFAAAWPKGGTPPADEPKEPTRGSRAGDATGHGSPVEQRYVAVERTVGVLRASVSVRYTR